MRRYEILLRDDPMAFLTHNKGTVWYLKPMTMNPKPTFNSYVINNHHLTI